MTFKIAGFGAGTDSGTGFGADAGCGFRLSQPNSNNPLANNMLNAFISEVQAFRNFTTVPNILCQCYI